MTNSDSIWIKTWNRLMGRPQRRNRSRQSFATHRRHLFESLEDRSVLSATFGSALNIGGNGSDGAFDIEADAAGYSYVTGDFEGTVDFDLTGSLPGNADVLTARGSRDAFVAKYAPDDSLVWVRRMGGDIIKTGASDVGRNISLDASGNVYVVGDFFESADFGSTTLTSLGGSDQFVAKFTSAGNLSWVKQWGTAESSSAHGLDLDASGNVYTLSYTSQGYNIAKFKSNGTQSWSQLVAATPGAAADLAVSPSGNVYAAGIFQGTADFDPSTKVKSVSAGSSQAYAAFVLNLDTNGKFKWVTPFVSQIVGSTRGYSMANSVSLDNSGNVYVGGYYHNTVDFNPGSGTTTLDPSGGAYLAKLNSAGGLTWAKTFLSGPASYVESIDVDSSGNIYATGYFNSSIDLNPNSGIDVRNSNGLQDIFVVKLTASGGYVWGETFGGVGADIAYGVSIDNAGFVHIAGYFLDEVDFDPDPNGSNLLGTPGGSRNGFRLRLRSA